jgi:hypothetical protein
MGFRIVAANGVLDVTIRSCVDVVSYYYRHIVNGR